MTSTTLVTVTDGYLECGLNGVVDPEDFTLGGKGVVYISHIYIKNNNCSIR